MINNRIKSIFDQMLNEHTWWSGKILHPGTSDYQKAVPIFSKRLQTYPSLVIQPRSTQEAALVFSWAKKYGIKLRIRGGGNSYEGYSSWSGVQLDTRLMKGFTLNRKQQTAQIEAGVLWGEVYKKLDGTGLVAMGGLIPTIGVMGLILGGGFNHALSRKYGMACDSALCFTVVLHDGSVLKNVSSENHADLWWALRGGGGGNFGLVTEVTLQLHPSGGNGKDKYITYTGYYNDLTKESAIQYIKTWHEWTSMLAEKNECRISADLEYDPEGTIRVWFVWSGNSEEIHVFNNYMDIWYRSIPSQANYGFQTSQSWLEVCKSERLFWDMPFPYEKRWTGSSAFFSDLSEESITQIVNDSHAVTTFILEAGDQNKSEEWSQHSAFPFRKAKYLTTSLYLWQDQNQDQFFTEKNKELFNGLRNSPGFEGCYINYINAQSPDWEKDYYGHSLERLKSIKSQYDPDNYFQFAQSIPASSNQFKVLPLIEGENAALPIIQELIFLIRNNTCEALDIIDKWMDTHKLEKQFKSSTQALIMLVDYANRWINLLPGPKGENAWKNPFVTVHQSGAGLKLLRQSVFKTWLLKATQVRNQYMETPESAKAIVHWEMAPGYIHNTYEASSIKYQSFKHFADWIQIDVMMPVARKDMDMMHTALKDLIRYSKTKIRRIYIVWQGPEKEGDPEPEIKLCAKQPEIFFIHEKVYPFTIDQINKKLQTSKTGNNHGSWYYQQLLKLYSFRILPDVLPRLLIHDADVAFSGPVSFLDEIGSAILSFGYPFRWSLGQKNFKAYGEIQDVEHSHVNHAKRLVPDWKLANVFSGMQHHQVVNYTIMEEMLKKTEEKHGIPFWEAFINQVDKDKWNGASEYVLYFHFALNNYPEWVSLRHVHGVDVIHDALEPIRESTQAIASESQPTMVGCHGFKSLRDRLETMDYIPEDVRKDLLTKENNRLAFRIELNEGLLEIETW